MKQIEVKKYEFKNRGTSTLTALTSIIPHHGSTAREQLKAF